MERISSLAAWESFYVIIGSSAAALTGLQFVVVSVIGADPEEASGTEEIGAFGTPTVVHFCATLLVAAIVSAPWHALASARWAIGLCGVGGLGYAAAVVKRARAQKGYRPVLEDWIWHSVLPAVAYVALVVARSRWKDRGETPSSSSAERRCFSSTSESTTRGTRSSTSPSPGGRNESRRRSAADREAVLAERRHSAAARAARRSRKNSVTRAGNTRTRRNARSPQGGLRVARSLPDPSAD